MSRRNQPPACRGCRHLDLNGSCIYILNTGVSRPCPPGEGCIVKSEKPKRKRRILLPPAKGPDPLRRRRGRPAWAMEALSASVKARELYAAGAHDWEIAAAEGVCVNSVRKWRAETGRPGNRNKKGREQNGNQSDDPGRGPGR